MNRIDTTLAALRGVRPALVAYIMAGDPDAGTTARLLSDLPGAGADIIELGMPFADPMADGPAIQAAGQRALAAGMTARGTLDLVRGMRAAGGQTPIVLMGYYNPLLHFGLEAFCAEAAEAGVDGLLIVDLPPEESGALSAAAKPAGLALIHLVAPTTPSGRLPVILEGAQGFLYYVSITGVTGAASADAGVVAQHVARIRADTDLPIAVGFGVKTPADAAALSGTADAVVVGAAIVNAAHEKGPDEAVSLTRALSEALKP